MGPIAKQVWIHLAGDGEIAAVRRAVSDHARENDLSQHRAGELLIAATELATNVVKHAGKGSMLVRRIGAGLQLLTLDSGPGMPDPLPFARQGGSTAGTLGIGLGAIARLSDWHDAYSLPGRGSVFAAGFACEQEEADGLIRPLAGESACGDGFAVRRDDGLTRLMMSDGLGHGPLAESATRNAVRAFLAVAPLPPAELLRHLHEGLRHTRGAAVGVAELDPAQGRLRFAGLGNINGVIAGREQRNLTSLPGIVGHQSPTVRAYDYALPVGALVILHSDGLNPRWNLDSYPGLRTRAPLVIAATLLRDAGLRRDDAGVLVART
ncbi:ATP-binding protein [Nonomuraea sp. NPDC050663]|uniref:ATP-binding protein n=1 Tax=Nonomuraea sp. NPDC050663 TaxID=3364370 RepID=UPI00379EEE88